MSSEKAVSRRRERREQMRRKQQSGRWSTIALITAGAILIVLAFIYPSIKPLLNIVSVEANPRPNAERNNMGDPNAPVHITEFSDFQCPYCKRFATETEHLIAQYYVSTGKVFFTYRSAGNWVSDNIARATNTTPKTESQDAANAAYCAADQGKFWEMHDALFANSMDVEDKGSFSGQRLRAIAKSAGLDTASWQDCYNSGKYKDEVQQDLKDAQAVDIGGTPFFVITYRVNGEEKSRIINGAEPFNTFQVELEAALAEAGAN